MKFKKTIAFMLCLTLCLTAVIIPVSADSGMSAFGKLTKYDNRFTDINGWYVDYVIAAYESQLITGTGDTTFSPNSNLSVGSAVALAARIHKLYNGGGSDFEAADDPALWYMPYYDYCVENGLFSQYTVPTKILDGNASRRQVIMILSKALPDSELKVINSVEDDSIPDISKDDPDAATIYKFYRAGVLTGDNSHAFNPSQPILRSEMAAIITRLTLLTPRSSVTLKRKIVPPSPPDWSVFDDTVFIGDSVSLKLSYYVAAQRHSNSGYFGGGQFLVSGSLSNANSLWEVSSQSVHPTYQGKKMRLEESVPLTGAKKVFIMLGINDVAIYGVDKTIENLNTLLGLIKDAVPDVTFFIQSVTPICKGCERSDLTNALVERYDTALKTACEDWGVQFVDVASQLRGSDGYLPRKYCSDPDGMGIHFTDAACEIWVDYLYRTLYTYVNQ